MTRNNGNRVGKKRNRRRKAKRILNNMQHHGKSTNGEFDRSNNVVTAGGDDQRVGVNIIKSVKYDNACNHYDIPEDTIRSWYDRIYHKLNEGTTKRVYHNWSCMLAPKRIELENAKPYIVLAAFFQYYEFDLEKSCVVENCKIFKEFCQDGMVEDEDMKQLVCRLLGEKSTEPISSDVDDDMAFLLDLDLLILASTPDVYKNYAELSRQEWTTSGKTNFDFLRRKSHSDERPTTSRYARRLNKKIKQRSPKKNEGGKVYRFKKIKDDKARKLVRRSLSIISDHQTPRRLAHTPKCSKRIINNHKKNTSPNSLNKKTIYHKLKKSLIVDTLENGEIRSRDNISLSKTQNIDDNDSDDDDCIVIEPTVLKIVIDDEDKDDDTSDNDEPSTSIASTTTYQSLMKSFNQHPTSTPCNKLAATIKHSKEPQSPSYANVAKNQSTENDSTAKEPVLFFEDVAGAPWFESINSVDTFTDYTKFSTLRENPTLKRRSIRLTGNTSQEIINLDDSHIDNESTLKSARNKLKRKSCELDDSVVFISETNKNDFIPIGGKDDNIKYKVRKRNESPSTPTNRPYTNNLYTKSETKQLNAYNQNAYNPSAGEELATGKRMVLIDGNNVAYKHALDKEFSVKGLKIAIEYFEKIGHQVKAVIPQFRMNRQKYNDSEELDKLHKSGKIVLTPCKNLPGLTSTSYDDRFILQLAFELDAAIVSNDYYRDLLHENPAFKKIVENRVIGFTWCDDIFILPKDPYGKWGPTLQSILNRC